MADIPENIPDPDAELIRGLLESKPPEFTELTLTQREAFADDVLGPGNNLVIAETGNGKTFVAEAVIKKALQDSSNVAYLVPSVALVSEKHETLNGWTPESVTINPGYGYNDADVIVATFESFFEAVIRGYASRFDTVILDDFHEIYSDHRGPNIEKGISAALDNDAEILAISATIGNPHTVTRWLDADLTISSEERAVPIDECPVEKTAEAYADQIARVIHNNREKGPFLVFNNTTGHAVARARGVAETLSFDVPSDIDFAAAVEDCIQTELTDTHKELISMLRNGVAYHHSKLDDELKALIESYTEDGIINCVCSTTTLSYGFDSPVQSVIVADLKHWTGEFIGIYEYIQWIGRAGRDAEMEQAYAFPMYSDENAHDRFQFDTPVEQKDLEDVTSHLSTDQALQWLVLELVTHGWETDAEILEFIESTLLWSENAEQIPQHIRDDYGVDPGDDIRQKVDETLSWLVKHGLISKPIGQPQDERTLYDATEMGVAAVEYEHSNWFDDSVPSVLQLAEWLAERGDEITPEHLVQRLAGQYYHCDEGEHLEDEPTLGENMHQHNLKANEGSTAALVCWFWCAGASLGHIEDALEREDLSSLPTTASNISTGLDSLSNLYTPYDMPDEPAWLSRFSSQVEHGVPGPDMYLIENTEYFGRALYKNLREKLDTTTPGESDWDPGEERYLIERLSALLGETGDDLFETMVGDTYRIGDSITENLLESVEEWDPDGEAENEVPLAMSAVERPETETLERYHNLDVTSSTDDSIDNSPQSTTLDDF